MKRWRRVAAKFLVVAMIMTGAVTATPSVAQASEATGFLATENQHYYSECGRFWPSTGYFQTNYTGSAYFAAMNFKLTQTQINALACMGTYLELDFSIYGFRLPGTQMFGTDTCLPGQWDDYALSSNIPGAIHDLATFDFSCSRSTPGATRIRVSDLQAGVEYYTSISFSLPLNASNGPPRVSFDWVPSYWASNSINVLEEEWCSTNRLIGGDAECVFPKTRVYLSHGYNNNVSLAIDGQYRWWEYSSATLGSSISPTADASPTPSGNPFGYLDDAGMVADQSKLYVRGWAIDPNTTGPVSVQTYVDGNLVGTTTANTLRTDVGAAYTGYGNNHGYYAEYTVGFGFHQICTKAVNTGAGDTNPQLSNCRTVERTLLPAPATGFNAANNTFSIYAKGTDGTLATWWQNSASSGFSGPASLGGSMASGPVVVRNATNNTLSVYATGTDGQLVTWWQNTPSSGFSGPQSLGGSITGTPSAVFNPINSTMSVYARGINGNLQTWRQDSAGSAFTGPDGLGGSISSDPTAVINPVNNTVSVYAVGTNRELTTWRQNVIYGAFIGPDNLGGTITTKPSPVFNPFNNTFSVYSRGGGSDLSASWQNSAGSGFTTPVSLGGSMSVAPVAMVNPFNNTVSVYTVGTNGQLVTWHQNSVGSAFTGPNYLGGTITGTPFVVRNTVNNSFSVYARGGGSDLSTWWQSSATSGFSTPQSLGGSMSSNPVAVFSPVNNTVSVYAVGTNGQLETWWQNSAGSSFSGPQYMGGSIQ